MRESARLFEAATLIEPEFDAAHSGRARALSIVWNFAGAAEADTLAADGMRAAQRALELNPRNAEAHSALGYIQFLYLWQWEQGLRETRLAITLAPNDAEVANFAGDLFRFAGDMDLQPEMGAPRDRARPAVADQLFRPELAPAGHQ